MSFPQIVLHQSKTAAVQRYHPWIFSGAIKKLPKGILDGDIVDVTDERGRHLATGHYSVGSIAVRVFSFAPVADLRGLWKQKFENALALRETIGLTNNSSTNCYRLIFAEGDGMPGLIVDWYNGTAVIQCHSLGMNKEKKIFTEILKEIYGSRLVAVYDKSAATLHGNDQSTTDGYLYGTAHTGEVLENNLKFKVDWAQGQKTGFFIDQRDNRALLQHYAKGKNVLNTFCYSGGFSVYALQAGAAMVHSVDSSAKAVEWTNENMTLNDFSDANHRAFAQDVFEYFAACETAYDVMVLDPPAFAKNLGAKHNALKAYKRLNETAFKKINSGGIVFTFSCSQVITTELFYGAVMAAAIDAGRTVQVLHQLSQPPDHPSSVFHPEGKYLKGLVLSIT